MSKASGARTERGFLREHDVAGVWDTLGKPAIYLLTKVGTIEYYCRYHPNMKGTIVVAPR
jgi:plastocyanin